MSVTIRQIDPQCKIAHYLTLPQLETIIPPQVIQEVLTECEAWEQREKKLNMQAMRYLLMALALYPQCSTREAYRRLLEGLSDGLSHQDEVPTAGPCVNGCSGYLECLFAQLAAFLTISHRESCL